MVSGSYIIEVACPQTARESGLARVNYQPSSGLLFCLRSSAGSVVGLEALPLIYFQYLAAILICYCVMTQQIKKWYIKRYGRWL